MTKDTHRKIQAMSDAGTDAGRGMCHSRKTGIKPPSPISQNPSGWTPVLLRNCRPAFIRTWADACARYNPSAEAFNDMEKPKEERL